MSQAGSEPQRQLGSNRWPPMKPRACLHCHARKVRCDAWAVGVPCSRCKNREQGTTCALIDTPTKGPNKSPKRKRITQARSSTRSRDILSDVSSHQDPQSQLLDPSFELSEPTVNINANHETTPGIPSHISRSEDNVLTPAFDPRIQASDINDNASEREEDVQLRIYQAMSQAREITMSPSPQPESTSRREVIEFHEGINSMTILGEVFGEDQPTRLVKVVVAEEGDKTNQTKAISSLDEADLDYISKKGALSFPPRPVCDDLLRLYFRCIYPYAPILDRVKFIEAYKADRHSPFLLQAILANVVPYAPTDLLHRAGYQDRTSAQKSLFSKAKLLYDLYEKNQLSLLQGSIMLSSLSFSYAMDKDYRYWLSNAARIATQMGLHRNHVYETLGKRTKRLFRRIWWVLFNRDTLLAISGVDNLRRFNDQYCDTSSLTKADWEDEIEAPRDHEDILRPISALQISFMVEYSKLSLVSGCFVRDFKTPGKAPTRDEIESLSDRISLWRKELPPEMQVQSLQEWSEDKIWILVLLAMGYRLEAVFCRAVKAYHRSQNETTLMEKMAQRQESAMFELSTMIQRASLHEMLHLCPLSFMTCASTNLAMRIEIANDPSVSLRKQASNKTQIFAELEYLRESCESWSSLVWTLRMFEAVITRTRLNLPSSSRSTLMEDSMQIQLPQLTTPSQARAGQNGDVGLDKDIDLTFALSEDCFGILPVSDNYDWLQSLSDMSDYFNQNGSN